MRVFVAESAQQGLGHTGLGPASRRPDCPDAHWQVIFGEMVQQALGYAGSSRSASASIAPLPGQRSLAGSGTVQLRVHFGLTLTRPTPSIAPGLSILRPTPLGRAEGWMTRTAVPPG